MTSSTIDQAAVDRATLIRRVSAAVASVADPEMPGVAITELGLVHCVTITDAGEVSVELMPTFSGCPALTMIRADVHDAVLCVDSISSVAVRFVDEPRWSTERISPVAEAALARLGVAVERDGIALCPRCGAETRRRSLFGPTRCRAIHRCESCAEVVEVMR